MEKEEKKKSSPAPNRPWVVTVHGGVCQPPKTTKRCERLKAALRAACLDCAKVLSDVCGD